MELAEYRKIRASVLRRLHTDYMGRVIALKLFDFQSNDPTVYVYIDLKILVFHISN